MAFSHHSSIAIFYHRILDKTGTTPGTTTSYNHTTPEQQSDTGNRSDNILPLTLIYSFIYCDYLFWYSTINYFVIVIVKYMHYLGSLLLDHGQHFDISSQHWQGWNNFWKYVSGLFLFNGSNLIIPYHWLTKKKQVFFLNESKEQH